MNDHLNGRRLGWTLHVIEVLVFNSLASKASPMLLVRRRDDRAIYVSSDT
jgi:hypothetical protein